MVDIDDEHPNVRRLKESRAALGRGDVETWAAFFDPEMELHVPPALPWQPGALRGAGAIAELWSTLMAETDNTFRDEVASTTGGDGLVLTFNRVSATRRGVAKTWDTAWAYRLVDGKAVEAWLVPSLGHREVEEFWG